MTELDLRHSLIPDELVEELVKTMPEHSGAGTTEDRNLPKYDYITFMERYMGKDKPATTFAQPKPRPRSSSPTKPTNGHWNTPSTNNTNRQYVDIF